MTKGSGTDPWKLYEFLPSFVLGFHGLDQSVGEKILSGKIKHLKASENEYDWLGHGIYFWEGNPQRAMEFAKERANGGRNSQGDIKKPFVLGAIIDLGRCLNLVDSSALRQLADAYYLLKTANPGELPTNGKQLLARKLDCAVMQTLHTFRQVQEYEPFQSVRGAFFEGEDLYENAGFKTKNHIQICIRDTHCIRGYFRPIMT
ncbi:hypothetical protein [Thiohalomonas denitrificans]|uniref:hypothetical protein n=1 Tax=Thiohalomonas denitrificans TaxID=415747 RepID=UPI0026F20461|nr:hypothetical protein [Thiohalomonas denitrificans]